MCTSPALTTEGNIVLSKASLAVRKVVSLAGEAFACSFAPKSVSAA